MYNLEMYLMHLLAISGTFDFIVDWYLVYIIICWSQNLHLFDCVIIWFFLMDLACFSSAYVKKWLVLFGMFQEFN